MNPKVYMYMVIQEVRCAKLSGRGNDRLGIYNLGQLLGVLHLVHELREPNQSFGGAHTTITTCAMCVKL